MTDEAKVVMLGGRGFREIAKSTIRRRYWTQAVMDRAGLMAPVMEGDEDAEHYARRIWRQVTESAEVCNLIGGLLMPADKTDLEWTPEIAAHTAAFVATLTAEEDHRIIDGCMLALVIGFFVNGTGSKEIFRRYSGRGTVPQKSIGGIWSSASGRGSSGRWLATTLGALWRWLTGRFAKRSSPTWNG